MYVSNNVTRFFQSVSLLLLLWILSTTLLYAEDTSSPASAENFPPADNVTALFEFNNNVEDSSGNNRHATLIGGGFAPTPCGIALSVNRDGTDVGLDWSAHAALLSHPFTIEMVVTPLETSSYAKLFSGDDSDDRGWYYHNQGFRSYPTDSLGQGQILPGERHYFAFVSTSNQEMNVYFQGTLLGTAQINVDQPFVNAVFFRDDAATGRGEQLTGNIDALRISSVSRSAEEIAAAQQHLNQNCTQILNQTYLPQIHRQ